MGDASEPGTAPRADGWQPALYDRFRTERRQPALDLMALIEPPAHAPRVLDLGCGAGELTRELHERLGAVETLGLDRSPAMLDAAQARAGGGLRFAAREIAEAVADPALAGRFDVVFSNAALQWVPEHRVLWPALARLLAPAGQLAIQIPARDEDVTHTACEELAHTPPFARALAGSTNRLPILRPEEYAALLFAAGLRPPRVELRVYPHELTCREELVTWFRGSLLTTCEARLDPELFRVFLDAWRQRVFGVYPDVRPLFLGFRRVLMWARRAD